MANITYNNIIQRLNDFADKHFFIRSFSNGDLAEADIKKKEEFPKMHTVYLGSDLDGNQKTYNFDIYILDLAKDKDEKLIYQQEIISDAEQILEDLISDVNLGFNIFVRGEDYNVESANLEPLNEAFSNVLSGATLNLSISVPFLNDTCNAPLIGVTPSSGECAPATVLDTDGVTTFEVASGGSGACSAPVCADAVITDTDGVTTFNVASGGTGTCTPCPPKSGYLYLNIIPTEYTSYRTGDVGYYLQNSTYKYSSKPSNPLVYVELNFDPAKFPYEMVENNEYGTKHRFTTDDGTPASDGRANFVIGDFATSTTWYVRDHYLGLGIYIANLGKQKWNDYIDDCLALTVGAYSDFRPFSISEFIAMLNKQYDYNSTHNIFRQGVVSGDTEVQFQFGSSASEYIPATWTYMYTFDGVMKLAQKAYTNLAGYAVRTHR